MRIYRKIVIVGLGLIGGSLGMALKKSGIASEIVGVSRKNTTLKIAKDKKAIDWCTKDLKKAVADADIVILATPVQQIINFAPVLAKLLPKDCIVSDVGSTKVEIVKAFEKNGINFVGAHPLAGSEKQSVKFADHKLFNDALCILTPARKTSKRSLESVKNLWELAGARTKCLSPDKHDEVISVVSHLPHLVAFSLVDTLPSNFVNFVSSGFRDTTRIAGSDAQIWKDIFISNRKCLIKNVEEFIKKLQYLVRLIRKNDQEELLRTLKLLRLKRFKL